MLSYWQLRYHRTNSQLWMVPLGLILLITPAIVWLSIFISHTLSSSSEQNEEDHDDEALAVAAGGPALKPDDPERC